MSKGILRDNRTCQNCGHQVTDRFCPSCGQENSETKKSFHYLFTHFLEDLVHYDNSFWKALKYLLYAPEKLSITYLSGKRKAFMAPVRLFIFINIFSFIIFSAFTFKDIEKVVVDEMYEDTKVASSNDVKFTISKPKNGNEYSDLTYIDKKLKKLDEEYTPSQISQKVSQKALQNLPKWLFFIMPFFAFILWLTHNKKKWWYFDHGIFTFHYFASFLLILSITTLINQFLGLFNYETNGYFLGLILLYLNIIFIRAYIMFYNESLIKNILKLFVIYFFNFIILLITFTLFAIYIVLIL